MLQESTDGIDAEEVIRVVGDLVRIPSVNPPGNEAAVVEYIARLLDKNGIPCAVTEALPGRPNLTARIRGTGDAPTIMFSGHTDVVPISESEAARWVVPPFGAEVQDGRLYGRGAADMKGGLGAALVAFLMLARSTYRCPGDVVFSATADEEDVMRGAKHLVRSGAVADAHRVVICEPTEMRINTSSKGRTWGRVTVHGRTAHASLPGAGINAIHHATRFATLLQATPLSHTPHPLLGGSWWQITEIEGGIEPAIVPDACSFTLDARLVPGQKPEDVWSYLEELIQARSGRVRDFSASVEVIEERAPWETDENDPIVRALRLACKASSIPVHLGGFLGTTDGAVFHKAGISGAAFGPGSIAQAHRENEYVLIEDLVQAARVYLRVMQNGLPASA